MVRVEQITALPQHVALQLAPYSADEWRWAQEMGMDVVGQGEFGAVVYDDEVPLLAVGFNRPVLLGPAYLWFLLCEAFTPVVARNVLPLWRGVRMKYPVIQTAVDSTLQRHCRFARFFGFYPTGREFDFFGYHYEVYEARN